MFWCFPPMSTRTEWGGFWPTTALRTTHTHTLNIPSSAAHPKGTESCVQSSDTRSAAVMGEDAKSAAKDGTGREGWQHKRTYLGTTTDRYRAREQLGSASGAHPSHWWSRNPPTHAALQHCPARAAPASVVPRVSGEGEAAREWQGGGGRQGGSRRRRRCKRRVLTNEVATLR